MSDPISNPAKILSVKQIETAARQHGLEPAALRAVIAVESGGSGFQSNGDVKILFERHLLWRRLQIPGREINPRPLAAAHPGLCGPSWNAKLHPYGATGSQWDRVRTVITWAQQHDKGRWESYKKAAYESCSYGLFQLLGMNYEAAGYENIYAFKHAHERSEAEQLQAILKWMSGNGLLQRLREKDWTRFVAGYNGPGQIPKYRGKLIDAYQRYSV